VAIELCNGGFFGPQAGPKKPPQIEKIQIKNKRQAK
jgi:hypothetical protein